MTTNRQFNELLRDCQVQSAYYDVAKRRRRAPVEALLALLGALGVDIQSPSQAGDFLHARRDARLARGMDPVHVAWNGAARPVLIRLPSSSTSASLDYELRNGPHSVECGYRLDELPIADDFHAKAHGLISRRLPLPKQLPPGYHDLTVHAGGATFNSLVISSPRKAFRRNHGEEAAAGMINGANGRLKATDHERPECGCFLPLYALRTDRDWGVGDLSSLGELVRWAGKQGASDVGTLPLLPAFLDEPFEISPYRPVSRLFWNELYIDVEAIPELKDFSQAERLIWSDGFRERINSHRDAELVDYREVMNLKQSVLELLAEKFFADPPARAADFRAFVAENPLVEDYARFRAAGERQRKPWTAWPEHMRQGQLSETDYDPAAFRYHQFVQWVANEQLHQLQQDCERTGCRLYLDLPVGVDPGGYDVWRFPAHYAAGASVGSPPDRVFPKGQDWGLPPLHPDGILENGYELMRRVMENNCRFAGRLRIDHVLGFHRLYCIPPGFGPAQGAYVHYRAEELYAVAILESHRHRCELVGENLGTVPAEVNHQIDAHDIAGMWVAPYELEPGRRAVLTPPTPNNVAMLNTHDMPPFEAWWAAADIGERLQLGLIDAAAAAQEREERRNAIRQLKDWLRARGTFTMEDEAADDRAPLIPMLRAIAGSPARLLLLNLEDLWRETRPQNIPGTSDQRPNWRRKARYRLEEFCDMPEVLEVLDELTVLRKEQLA